MGSEYFVILQKSVFFLTLVGSPAMLWRMLGVAGGTSARTTQLPAAATGSAPQHITI